MSFATVLACPQQPPTPNQTGLKWNDSVNLRIDSLESRAPPSERIGPRPLFGLLLHLAWQPPLPQVLSSRLRIHARLGRRDFQRQFHPHKAPWPFDLPIADHTSLVTQTIFHCPPPEIVIVAGAEI